MTKEDLKRIGELRKEINRSLILWENAKESATRTTTVITGMPRSSSANSQVEVAVIKAEVYRDKYYALCDELNSIYAQLRELSKRYLNEQEAKLLQMVYPQGKRMHEVAKALNITERHAYRIKNTAIYKVCR